MIEDFSLLSTDELLDRLPDLLHLARNGNAPEHDDMFWTLDSGNNWKVKFYEEEPKWFKIIYRYQSEEGKQEEAFAGWRKMAYNGKTSRKINAWEITQD